jgi:cytochrome c oxidase assembly factor CtaG
MPLATRRGVTVGQSSGWEEDHVVVVTQGSGVAIRNLQGMVAVTRKPSPTWRANYWCCGLVVLIPTS